MTLINNNDDNEDLCHDGRHCPTRNPFVTLVEQEQVIITIDANNGRYNLNNAPSNFIWNILEQALEISSDLDIVVNQVLAQVHNEYEADNSEHEAAESNQEAQEGHHVSVPRRRQ